MKNIAIALSLLAFTACASKTPKPKYMEEKNQAKFATSFAFAEKPEKVFRAARAVLDKLSHESNPPIADAIKGDENTVYTAWVYSQASRDKYVQYDYNGSPRRKDLAVRRIYSYTVTPSLAGSQVALNIEEEIQDVDLKTGQPKDWKRVQTEQAAFDMLLHKLREQVRAE